MVTTMCGVQLRNRKRAKVLMLGLNETIDQLISMVVFCGGRMVMS